MVDLLQAEYLDRQKFDQKSFNQRLTLIINSTENNNKERAEDRIKENCIVLYN